MNSSSGRAAAPDSEYRWFVTDCRSATCCSLQYESARKERKRRERKNTCCSPVRFTPTRPLSKPQEKAKVHFKVTTSTFEGGQVSLWNSAPPAMFQSQRGEVAKTSSSRAEPLFVVNNWAIQSESLTSTYSRCADVVRLQTGQYSCLQVLFVFGYRLTSCR